MMRCLQLSLLLACVLLSACSEELLPPLVASNVNIVAPIPGKTMSAGYLSITNNTADTVRISRVESAHFESVQIHESVVEDGIAKMHRLDELTIPARSTVKLEPGGKHLMLMRPTGTADQISLSFFSAETLLLGVTATLTTRTN